LLHGYLREDAISLSREQFEYLPMGGVHLDHEKLVYIIVLCRPHICHEVQRQDRPIALISGRLEHNTHASRSIRLLLVSDVENLLSG